MKTGFIFHLFLFANLGFCNNDFHANPQLVSAYEHLIGQDFVDFPQLRTDIDILSSYYKLLNNHPAFMQEFGDKVRMIVMRLGEAGASCNSCPSHTQNLVKPYMKSINQHLDDLEFMINRYTITPGFTGPNSLINEMASSWQKADGASFIMHYIRNNQSEFDGLTRFEFRYNDEIGNRADVLVGEVNYEMKSWVKGGQTWNDFFKGSTSSNSYQQFLSYLANTDNLTNLKYVFNRAKASESDVKSAFKSLFSIPSKRQQLFSAMTSELKGSLFGPDEALQFDVFNSMVNDISSPLYGFISN